MRQLGLLWERRSITWKLPLSIGAILCAVMLSMAFLAYVRVERALLEVTDTRLQSVARQLQELLDQSVRQRYATMSAISAEPGLSLTLASGTPASDFGGRARLEQYRVSTPQVWAVELWDSDGARRAFVGEDLPRVDGAQARELAEGARQGRGATGQYHMIRDTLEWETAVAIDGGARPSGFVVERRRIAGNPEAVRQLSRLIGNDARFAVGNRDGSLWTDLATTTTGPPATALSDTSFQRYRRGDGTYVAARVVAVQGTPWLVLVEFNLDAAIAPARRFLYGAIGIALLLGVAGTAAGTLISSGITRPLRDLSDASRALAAGGSAVRVTTGRLDEIGTLEESFNAMSAEIEQGREQIAATLDQYRMLFEQNPMPMWVFDPSTLAFLDVNDAAVKHYGYTRQECLSMTLSDIRPSDEPPKLQQALAEHLDTPAGHFRHRRKDGSEIDVEVTRRELSLRGRQVYLVLLNDVTQKLAAERELDRSAEALRKSQEQLMHAQKMEALGRLAGGVAHDFNNLTTVVLGFAELLHASFDDADPRRRDAQEIQRAARGAADLTARLLAFSRRQMVEVRPLQVNDVVANTERMLKRLIGEDIDLVTSLAPDLGSIESDPSLVEQALMNLVVNARDAMPSGGKLTIETSSIELDDAYVATHLDAKPGRHVLVAVTDTGTGISPEIANRIFEPFFTTKPKGEGTGLGLSTVYGIVRQSGGHVGVYSEPGRGTSVKMYFPESADAEPRSVSPTPSSRAAIGRPGEEVVLVVEDDPAVRGIVGRVLRTLGYRVLEARSGAEAIEHAEAGAAEIALIISDVVMPEMSGPELIGILRERVPHARVVFMSGYTDDAVVRHGMLSHDEVFLQKPFTLEAFARKIREVLDGARG